MTVMFSFFIVSDLIVDFQSQNTVIRNVKVMAVYLHLSSPFPPEIFLYSWTHCAHEVVKVHDDVNSHVQESTEGCVTSTNKPENIKSLLPRPITSFA